MDRSSFSPAPLLRIRHSSLVTPPDESWQISRLERGLLCLDADDAGRQGLAAWRALLAWAEPAPLPEGAKDVSEFWRRGGDVGEWIGRWVEMEGVSGRLG